MLEAAADLPGRLVRHGLARDREEPEQDAAGRDGERGDGRRDAAQVASLERRPREQEAHEREEQEDRVGRMDEGEDEPGARDRSRKRKTRLVDEGEDEREGSRRDELARARRREREHAVRAAATRGERDRDDGGEDDRDPEPRRTEERVPGLVGDGERERREDARLVAEDLLGIDAGDSRNRSEEPVPERERVARMEPTVAELVHGAEPQAVEGLQLADAREVEQPVALHRARDMPERDPEADPREDDEELGRAHPGALTAGDGEHERSESEHAVQAEREPERAVHEKGERETDGEGGERERESGRDARQPEPPGEEHAREEHGHRRSTQAQVELDGAHRGASSNELAGPEESQRAASR